MDSIRNFFNAKPPPAPVVVAPPPPPPVVRTAPVVSVSSSSRRNNNRVLAAVAGAAALGGLAYLVIRYKKFFQLKDFIASNTKEERVLKTVYAEAREGNVDSVIDTIDRFCYSGNWMMNGQYALRHCSACLQLVWLTPLASASHYSG